MIRRAGHGDQAAASLADSGPGDSRPAGQSAPPRSGPAATPGPCKGKRASAAPRSGGPRPRPWRGSPDPAGAGMHWQAA